MNIEDLVIPPQKGKYEKWQLGKLLTPNISKAGIILLWVSDFRGTGKSIDVKNIDIIQQELFKLSSSDFEIPICDLGHLISGITLADTHYILAEILLTCHKKGIIPITIGGGNDMTFPLFSALNIFQENINYTQITNILALSNDKESISDRNYLNKILNTKETTIKNLYSLGLQKHLNNIDNIDLLKEMNFETLRLAEMFNGTDKAEPFLRQAHLVTLNCDAIESFGSPFSINPQVNGLNKREICAYMKEIGLGENLKSIGIFNYNFEAKNPLNHQLFAQMLWYLLEGINIQKTHPKKHHYETYFVMIETETYVFHKDVFRNLWYFGAGENEAQWVPCAWEDFNNAKKGFLNTRFLKTQNQ